MTVYGYLRVHPQAVAGTSDVQGRWMLYFGCSEVYVDIWKGSQRPPMFERLLSVLRRGDEVRVPQLDVFGPTLTNVANAMTRLHGRGVMVVVIDEDIPRELRLTA
ncbi:recombinase family protein [Saccharopolyspora phatthalungensis]|uniref:DNA invertase Pin-like site-specific DNA recombinase n=1 Tax=Saccharopolyspora phatthalungensis TaxID=664693 RepID=A0A840Q5H5_9PSEU|nr:recombinase family protein [Saccharopolyspora phatthalungensis]MBB5154941.1 DNA invertase Pin-like site-specific DNA recombinase [Saccharopolyspora phatthalungensis]